METQKFDFFFFFQKSSKFEFWLVLKCWNHLSFVNISPTLVIDTSMERSSRVLQLGNPKIWYFFSKKFEIWILTLTKSWNHLSFVNISPTLAIDTSMERSSRILQHGIIKIWFKKIRNWVLTCFFLSSKLNFDLCRRAEIIRVGLNMHLYDDIGDASSSLRGSTSSFYLRSMMLNINEFVSTTSSTNYWKAFFKLVFILMAKKRKIFKQIAKPEYWSKYNVLYINGFVSTSSTN